MPDEPKDPGELTSPQDKDANNRNYSASKADNLEKITKELELTQQALRLANEKLDRLTYDGNVRTVDPASIQDDHIFFGTAFNNDLVGMLILDAAGNIIKVNGAFCNITGYREAELLNQSYLSLIYPDDRKLVDQGRELQVNTNGNSFTIDTRIIGNLKHTLWLRNSFSLLRDSHGIAAGLLILCININEEKRAHQKAEEITRHFRFLADSMPQQIWTADSDGKLNYFSHAFYEYSGILQNDAGHISWANIVLEDDLEKTDTLWKHSIDTGEAFTIEHRLKRRDGNYKWQLSRAMAQRDGHAKILMWVGSSTNIHDQKTIEEQLEKQVVERTRDLMEANFNLKHTNHDLEQFAYIATHDLQEPLRKIRTYSSWITKQFNDILPEEARNFMLKIENASERMGKLIQDLLDYSLLLRPQELFELTDLDEIMDQLLEDLDLKIRDKAAVIHRTPLPSVNAVPMQLYQLFYNLLGNALKFTSDEKSPVIHIQTRILSVEDIINFHLDMDVKYIEIAVKDNGIGFQQEYAEKIFIIFQQLNNREKFSGTGIGLALCHKIAVYHRGMIYACAKENEGACFYVVLPLPPEQF